MKNRLSMLLALLLMIPAAHAAELPVLTAQLGKSVNYESTQADGNEYVETLNTEDLSIYMARFAGELDASAAAEKMLGEVYDGELIAQGEDGIDERAVFLTGANEDTNAADISVIRKEDYTYVFLCVADADMYLDDELGADARDLVNGWVKSLEIFEDTSDTMIIEAETPDGSIGDALPVLTAQLGKAVEYEGSEVSGTEYIETLRNDTMTIYIARLTGELDAQSAAEKLAGEVYDGELSLMGTGIEDERATFLKGHNEDTDIVDISVIHRSGFTYAFCCVADADNYSDEDKELVDFWVETLEIYDPAGNSGAVVLPANDLVWTYTVPFDMGDGASYWEANSILREVGMMSADETIMVEDRILTTPDGDSDAAMTAAVGLVDPEYEDVFTTEQVDPQYGYPAYICTWNSKTGIHMMKIVITDAYTYILHSALADGVSDETQAMAGEMLAAAALGSYADDTLPVLLAEIGADIFPEAEGYADMGAETLDGKTVTRYDYCDAAGNAVGTLLLNADEGIVMVSTGTAFEAIRWNAAEGCWKLAE